MEFKTKRQPKQVDTLTLVEGKHIVTRNGLGFELRQLVKDVQFKLMVSMAF
jgi:hypothetical protein